MSGAGTGQRLQPVLGRRRPVRWPRTSDELRSPGGHGWSPHSKVRISCPRCSDGSSGAITTPPQSASATPITACGRAIRRASTSGISGSATWCRAAHMKMASTLPSGNGSWWMSPRTNGIGAGAWVEVDTDGDPAWPDCSGEPERSPTRVHSRDQPDGGRSGRRAKNAARSQGPLVRRTMPLPHKRLVDGTHIHDHIVAILERFAPVEYLASRRRQTLPVRATRPRWMVGCPGCGAIVGDVVVTMAHGRGGGPA
jgi:hypothetical protein